MVLKTCKPGHAGLNTGRTLRGSGRLPGRRYAFIRCCATSADAAKGAIASAGDAAAAAAVRQPAAAVVADVAAAIERAQLDVSIRDLSIDLPPDGVEYSLNKKSRWEAADRIRTELQVLAEEADCQVQLFEQHLRPRMGASGSRACTAFYSSGDGAGKAPRSKIAPGQRYMNAGSLAKEAESGKSRRRRGRQHRRRSGFENDAESSSTDASSTAELQAAGNRRRRIALACDVVRSVPSGSSAVYPARQSQAKRQKMVGRHCRKSSDVADLVSDYMQSSFSFDDHFCYDDELITDDDGESNCQSSPDSGCPIDTRSMVQENQCAATVIVASTDHTAHVTGALFLNRQGSHESGCEPHAAEVNQSVPQYSLSSLDSISQIAPVNGAGDGSNAKQCAAHVRLEVRQLGGKEVRILKIHDSRRSGKRQQSNHCQKQKRCKRDNAKDSIVFTNAVVSAASRPVILSGMEPITVRITPREDGLGVMEQLSSAFGDLYSDCRCHPRMCTVALRDISQKVSLACQCHPKHNQLSFHLVVQEKARQSDTYNVWLSADLRADQTLASVLGAAETQTLEELLESVEAYLLSLSHECFAVEPLSYWNSRGTPPSRAIAALYDVRRWSVACQTLDDVQQEVAACIAKLEEENERNSKDSQENFSLIPLKAQRSLSARQNQCGACFEELGSERAIMGASLTQCGHTFCLDCWRAYLNGKVTEGQSLLQCPEYLCPAIVDFATIVAICGPGMARRHRMKLAEVVVWKEGNVTWCPNPQCKRLVRVKYDRPQAAGRGEAACISCLCGRSFCFSCRDEPHWPLTCEQAVHYHQLLKQKGLFTSEQLMTTSLLVRAKPCPSCHYLIEKWTGCHHMTCIRCTAHFCWRCLTVLPASNAYQHVTPCEVPVDNNIEEHELGSLESRWSIRSSSLAGKAIESRRYKSSIVARRLERQVVALLARIELQTIKEFADLIACSAPSTESANVEKRVQKHLLKSVVAFKLDAHQIEAYSLACLTMGRRQWHFANAADQSAGDAAAAAQHGTSIAAAASARTLASEACRQLTKKRAVAELSRLSFTLGQLESLLLSLSSASSAKPTLDDLRRLDSLSSTGERSIRSVANLLAAFQDF